MSIMLAGTFYKNTYDADAEGKMVKILQFRSKKKKRSNPPWPVT